jgi:ribosomal protein RSM22 (predicted rRNA methylase)
VSTPPALLAVLAEQPIPAGIADAVEQLTARYKKGISGARAMRSALDHSAYITARMPATAAAVRACCKHIDFTAINSVLDFGSGPGSALWAVADATGNITKLTAIEQDAELIGVGKQLAQSSTGIMHHINWIIGDIRQPPTLEPHDLIVASYVTNELSERERCQLAHTMWQLARHGVLIIEPGTRAGSHAIGQLRQHFLSLGAFIAAPCTHAQPCPLSDHAERWCHFRVRVARSKQHRASKSATLGFEDEPYSFIYLTKNPQPIPEMRIVSHPRVHKGAVDLTVCHVDGISQLSVPRKNKSAYAHATTLAWGDGYSAHS